MNDQEVKGSWKQIMGGLKVKLGQWSKSEETEGEGRVEALEGKVQQTYGQFKGRIFSQINRLFKGIEEKSSGKQD